MPIFYLVKRVGVFFLIVWLAATVNFFLPRLGSENPIAHKIMQQAALGGNLHVGMQGMIKEYEEKFGLTQPLWRQYLTYLADMARFDLNYSIASYPRRVSDMILEGLPWTIALLSVTTVLSFIIGNVLGAFQAWPGAPCRFFCLGSCSSMSSASLCNCFRSTGATRRERFHNGVFHSPWMFFDTPFCRLWQ